MLPTPLYRFKHNLIYLNNILSSYTMKNIALKLQEEIFEETEEIIKESPISRNRYINEALKFYNSYQKRKKLKEQLQYESRLVAAESMSVLEDFEALYETDGSD